MNNDSTPPSCPQTPESFFSYSSENQKERARSFGTRLRRRKRKAKPRISSLDFDPIVNDYSIQALKDRLFDTVYIDSPSNADSSDNVNDKISRNENSENNESYGSTTDNIPTRTFESEEDPGESLAFEDFDLLSSSKKSAVLNELNVRLFHTNIINDDKSPLLPSSTSIPVNDKSSTAKAENLKKKRMRRKKRPFFGYSGKTMARWILTCIIGYFTGSAAVTIIKMSDALVHFRLGRLNRLQAEMHKDLKHIVYSNHVKDDDIFFDSLHDDDDIQLLSPILFLSWSYLVIFMEYLAFNLVLAMSSAYLCLLAPDAVGSGIPEIKAHLNGVRTKSFAKFKLFLVKIVGTILSVSSGLMVGPEGPLVHLGAIIGSSMTKTKRLEQLDYQIRKRYPLLSRFLGCSSREEWRKQHNDLENENTKLYDDDKRDAFEKSSFSCTNSLISTIVDYLSHLRNDSERRDFVSIGAAAGFAAAFGAPIGGVLFSLEEASTFFAHAMLWRTLTATAIATFCIAASHGDISQYGVISLGKSVSEDNAYYQSLLQDHFVDIPLYALIGAVGGLLGALFNSCYKYLNDTRIDIYSHDSPAINQKKRNRRWKLFEVALVSVFTSLLTFTIPLSFDFVCKEIGTENDLFRFNCKSGEMNQMAAILFGSREDAIKNIIKDPSAYDPKTLLMVGLLAYPLMVLTFGIPLPSGIFMPTILIGASLGGYTGIMIKDFYNPNTSTTTFALLGAAAMLGGIQRSTVSLCVILMEGTGQTKILIPVIVTIVAARFVGDLFNHGLYEIGMELKKYPYLEHHGKSHYDIFKVSDVMSTPPVTVYTVETAKSIETLLRTSPHHGFPVKEAGSRDEKFVGLVRRDQLIALLECGYFMENSTSRSLEFNKDSDIIERKRKTSNGSYLSAIEYEGVDGRDEWITDNVITVTKDHVLLDSDDTLPRAFIPVHQHTLHTRVKADKDGNLIVKVAKEDSAKRINIGAVMNRGAKCVTDQCPLSVAYRMFTTLGLRHLCVLGGENGGEVVGIVTRFDLRAEYIEERAGG